MVTENVEDRLEKLERTIRRYRLVFAGLSSAVCICAVIWVVLGVAGRAQAQKPAEAGKVVRANAFVLEDENGKTLAKLGASQGGSTLSLANDEGIPRVVLAVAKDEVQLGLYDESGKLSAILGVIQAGPRLILRDKNGKARVMLAESKAGPMLTLGDKDDTARAILGEGMLGLYDASGNMIWSAP